MLFTKSLIKKDDLNKFECTLIDVAQKGISNISNLAARPNAG